jgi:hypothetical protein
VRRNRDSKSEKKFPRCLRADERKALWRAITESGGVAPISGLGPVIAPQPAIAYDLHDLVSVPSFPHPP